MRRAARPILPPLPPPAHLALGDGATHAGSLDGCEACARAYAVAVRLPAGIEAVRDGSGWKLVREGAR